MDRFGLTPTRHAEFLRQIRLPHERVTEVHVLNRDYSHRADVSTRLLPGWQVDGFWREDAQADQVTWILQLQLADPGSTFGMDLDEPLRGNLGYGYMLQLIDRHHVDLGDGLEWVDCELFTGLIWGPSARSEGVLTLTCHSVDRRALGALGRAFVVQKRARKTKVIQDVLDLAGLRHAIPKLKPLVPKRSSFKWDRPGLPLANRLARSMDRQLLADGSGVMRLRRIPSKPVVAFRVGETITSLPAVADKEPGSNVVIVEGAKVKKKVVRATVRPGDIGLGDAARAPKNLGMIIPERIDSPQTKTTKKAVGRGKRVLTNRLTNVSGITFNATYLPGLWPGDVIVVDDGVSRARVRLRDFTLTESELVVGTHRRFRPRKGGRR